MGSRVSTAFSQELDPWRDLSKMKQNIAINCFGGADSCCRDPCPAVAGSGHQWWGSALAACWPHAFGFKSVFPKSFCDLKLTNNTSDYLLRKECRNMNPCVPVLSFTYLTEVWHEVTCWMLKLGSFFLCLITEVPAFEAFDVLFCFLLSLFGPFHLLLK